METVQKHEELSEEPEIIAELDSPTFTYEGAEETQANRISSGSRVNFNKLSNNEKVSRLQNMARKIKKLKQKVR